MGVKNKQAIALAINDLCTASQIQFEYVIPNPIATLNEPHYIVRNDFKGKRSKKLKALRDWD